jgi:hypothetical protein
MTLDHVDLLDDDASFIGMHTEDLATLAFIFASDDFDEIILADMPRPGSLLLHGYSTSGASETIFIYLLARSSRATGPKYAYPWGLRFVNQHCGVAIKTMYGTVRAPDLFGCAHHNRAADLAFLTEPFGLPPSH